ncbi:hypothetical protein JOC77_003767 [Peribacillus deserti]|uniref:DUF4083 domain-containing protein n=1 Tax=Peribacillus deserti TaxID=673318 RepID=A0ABS2QMB6_9BACI|nr:hypothetical protein [Peribacillus deserti]MBM7694306.1 hypothetical protein [Peribacillus deserti]
MIWTLVGIIAIIVVVQLKRVLGNRIFIRNSSDAQEMERIRIEEQSKNIFPGGDNPN